MGMHIERRTLLKSFAAAPVLLSPLAAGCAQRRHEVLDLSIDFDGDGVARQTFADAANDVDWFGSGFDLSCRTVGKRQCQLLRQCGGLIFAPHRSTTDKL